MSSSKPKVGDLIAASECLACGERACDCANTESRAKAEAVARWEAADALFRLRQAAKTNNQSNFIN